MDGNEKKTDAGSPAHTWRPRLWLEALLCSLLLAAEMYVLLHDIAKAPQGISGNPVIGAYVEGENEVLSRASGTISWNAPAPGAELRREDAMLTMPDANALVRFTDGTEMGIEPDSLVILEKAPDEGSRGNPKIVVRLKQGALAKKKPGGSPLAIDVETTSGSLSRIEDAHGTATFRVQATEDGLRLHVDGGDVVIGEGPGAKTIRAAQEAVIRHTSIEVRDAPSRFTDMRPGFSKIVVRERTGDEIQLAWAQTSNVEPILKVSKSPDMRDAIEIDVKDVDQGKGTAKLEAEDDGLYYWRLESADGAPTGPIARFEILTKSVPTIETPKDDFEGVVGRKFAIRWSRPTGSKAISTLIEIAQDDAFEAITRKITVARDAREVELVYDRPQTLHWRLRTDYGAKIGLSAPTKARKFVIKPKPLLKAPKISRPRVKTSAVLSDAEAVSGVSKSWRTSSRAPASSATVELAWDDVEGASLYRLQIARDERFTALLTDKRVRSRFYSFQTTLGEHEQTFYYRVASVDAEGTEGPFSEARDFEIPARLRPPLVTPPRPQWRLDVAAGAALHSRTFKSEQYPLTASGSGIIPLSGTIEYHVGLGGDTTKRTPPLGVLDLGLSSIGEKATAKDKNIIAASDLAVSALRAWASYAIDLGETLGASLGFYAATSHQFFFSGRELKAKRLLLGGAACSLHTPLLRPARHWHWRAQAGAVAAGALGADATVSARYMLSYERNARVLEQTGPFVELETLGRMLTVETSFGGALKIGYSF